MKIDWINSWKKGNKKDTIYDISVRLGRFRFMILNLGFELCVCGEKCKTKKDCKK